MQVNNGMNTVQTQEFNPKEQLAKPESAASIERRIHAAIRKRDEKETLFLIAMVLQREESIDFINPRSLSFVSQSALQVFSLDAARENSVQTAKGRIAGYRPQVADHHARGSSRDCNYPG
jgi:hypothetical protein